MSQETDIYRLSLEIILQNFFAINLLFYTCSEFKWIAKL